MFLINVIGVYHHRWDGEWHVYLLSVENDFEYGDSRSLFSVGKKDERWFIDLFWMRLLPR